MPIKYKRTRKARVHHDGQNDDYFRSKNGEASLELLYCLQVGHKDEIKINEAFYEIAKVFSSPRENCFLYHDGGNSKSYCAIELESNLMVSRSFAWPQLISSGSDFYSNGISVLYTLETDKEKLKLVKSILRKRELAFRKEFSEENKDLFKETDEIFLPDGSSYNSN